MEPARGESFPSGELPGPAAPGEDRVSSPDQKSFHISTTNSNNPATKTGIPRVDTAPHGVETLTPMAGGWLLIGWGSWNQRAARVVPATKVEVASLTGRLRSYPRITNPSISLQLQQTGDHDGDPTGRYRLTRCGNPNVGHHFDS